MPRVPRAPALREPKIDVVHGDARSTGLPDKHFHACVTSPPYFGLREYGDDDREIGDEPTPEEYVAAIVDVGREVRRVLRDDAVWMLNLGDSFVGSRAGPAGVSADVAAARDGRQTRGTMREVGGLRPKSLIGVPWRVAFALQADGWILRAAIPWIKANPMPESVRDRPTVAHEYVFMLVKQPRYFWDPDVVRQTQTAISEARATRADHRTKEGRVDAYMGKPPAGIHAERDTSVGRNIRTSDFFGAGLDTIEDFAEHVARIREEGGLMLSPDGNPLAFMVNPVPNKLAHFAMWPPRLVAPMIKAATSERGCCPICGVPLVRTVETREVADRYPTYDSKKRPYGNGLFGRAKRAAGGSTLVLHERIDRGFHPSCSCPPAAPVPCRVLDPFGGSGTTAQVARELGRDCTLVELMEKNLAVIDQRLAERLDPETMKPRKRPR